MGSPKVQRKTTYVRSSELSSFFLQFVAMHSDEQEASILTGSAGGPFFLEADAKNAGGC